MKKRIPKSIKKYLRKEKSRIRRGFLDFSKRETELNESLKKVGLIAIEKKEGQILKKVDKKQNKSNKNENN
ncbi:MAG: hypothetical protein Q8O39_02275 [bacterium]|nr:hypothetical protein [bacterium]